MALSRNDLFRKKSPGDLDHPRLRRWRKLIGDHGSAELEVLRRWDGLTFQPARMFVTIHSPGQPDVFEESLWEADLDAGLVELGVRAKDVANEVIRTTLALHASFEPLSIRSGQDYVRSVLVTKLRASELVQHARLGEVLRDVHVNEPANGRVREEVGDAVEVVLERKGRELTEKLHYSEDEAFDILAGAVAQYLDEIFHVTARRQWFGAS